MSSAWHTFARHGCQGYVFEPKCGAYVFSWGGGVSGVVYSGVSEVVYIGVSGVVYIGVSGVVYIWASNLKIFGD